MVKFVRFILIVLVSVSFCMPVQAQAPPPPPPEDPLVEAAIVFWEAQLGLLNAQMDALEVDLTTATTEATQASLDFDFHQALLQILIDNDDGSAQHATAINSQRAVVAAKRATAIAKLDERDAILEEMNTLQAQITAMEIYIAFLKG